ncbi:hypothetical protein FQZ97_1044840 [compost metagenome]
MEQQHGKIYAPDKLEDHRQQVERKGDVKTVPELTINRKRRIIGTTGKMRFSCRRIGMEPKPDRIDHRKGYHCNGKDNRRCGQGSKLPSLAIDGAWSHDLVFRLTIVRYRDLACMSRPRDYLWAIRPLRAVSAAAHASSTDRWPRSTSCTTCPI